MGTIFRYIIISVALALFILSLTAFIAMQFSLFENKMDLSPEGISFYITAFSKYYGLFAATITLIVAYYGIERLRAAERANNDKVKLDRYADWRIITDVRLQVVKEDNPRFLEEFVRIRYKLFEDVYPSFSIHNKKELQDLFDKYFAYLVLAFETLNKKHQDFGGIYPSNDHSYFGGNLLYVFMGSLTGEKYEGANEDFKEIYLAKLDPERVINPSLYVTAVQNSLKFNQNPQP